MCGREEEVATTLIRALEGNTCLQTLSLTCTLPPVPQTEFVIQAQALTYSGRGGSVCGHDTSEEVARLLAEGLRRHAPRLEVTRCCPRPARGGNASTVNRGGLGGEEREIQGV